MFTSGAGRRGSGSRLVADDVIGFIRYMTEHEDAR